MKPCSLWGKITFLPATILCDLDQMVCLILESYRIWVQHGPCSALVGAVSHATFATAFINNEYRSGYRAVRHILEVTTSRHYVNEYSRVLFVFSISSGHWFEPVQKTIGHMQSASEFLLKDGDVLSACFAYYISVSLMVMESPKALEICLAEIQKAILIVERTGNIQLTPIFVALQFMIQNLSCAKEDQPQTEYLKEEWEALIEMVRISPIASAMVHLCRAIVAIIYDDVPLQEKHTAALLPLMRSFYSTFVQFLTYLLRAIALINRIRIAPIADQESIRDEFFTCRAWIARRAEESPELFMHYLIWIDAEYAATLNRFQQAVILFDHVLKDKSTSLQGWYRAVIAEYAGIFYLKHGVFNMGQFWLGVAHNDYNKWGAHVKVRQLEETYGVSTACLALKSQKKQVQTRSTLVDSNAIDMLAILRASQMLSSETSLERLEAKVVELLGTLTGATKVLLMYPNQMTRKWFLNSMDLSGQCHKTVSIKEADKMGLLPLSAVETVLRSKEPLLVNDASREVPFMNHDYFKKSKYISLMVVPILNKGELSAMLLLENRLSRAAFQPKLLDTVALITGQLAVSLENARLYASLEEKVSERTKAL